MLASYFYCKLPFSFQIQVTVESNAETIDVYHLSVGIRTIDVDDGKFLINGQSFYFRGFGRHEDADVSMNYCQSDKLKVE